MSDFEHILVDPLVLPGSYSFLTLLLPLDFQLPNSPLIPTLLPHQLLNLPPDILQHILIPLNLPRLHIDLHLHTIPLMFDTVQLITRLLLLIIGAVQQLTLYQI